MEVKETKIPEPQEGIICGVAFDRSSLRRITHTPQSSFLVTLHLIPSWGSGMFYGFPISFPIANLGGGFGKFGSPFKLFLVI